MDKTQGKILIKTFPVTAIRLDEETLEEVLDDMDLAQTDDVSANRRLHPRSPYRVRAAVVYAKQIDPNVAFVVPTRNISQGGIAFLHRHMMYVGQECTIQLAAMDGGWITVEGVIARCRHVKAMVHEIAVKFDEPLDFAQVRDVPGGVDELLTGLSSDDS